MAVIDAVIRVGAAIAGRLRCLGDCGRKQPGFGQLRPSPGDVIAIPEGSSRARAAENLGALVHPLDDAALVELDRLFPPPQRPVPLEML